MEYMHIVIFAQVQFASEVAEISIQISRMPQEGFEPMSLEFND